MPRILLALLLIVFAMPSKAQQTSFIVIGTGDLTGVYYPAGGAICRLLNKNRQMHGIRCAVESTAGSTYNLGALRRGELDLAIVQPDWLYHAARGSSIFAVDGANTGLRTLVALHAEQLTIVARKDSGIGSFEDLKGKRVNLGSLGSGQRRTMDLILGLLGWSYSDFSLASELSASEMSEALCSGRIDAFVYIVGHPNASISEATAFCDSAIIPLPEKLIKRLSDLYPYYTRGSINGALYRGNANPVPTISLTSRLVASDQLPNAVVSSIVNTLKGDFNSFRQMHPALQVLTPDKVFIKADSLAPVHAGAQ